MMIGYVNETALFQAAVLVSLSCLIFTLAQRHTDRPQNIIYIIMVVSLGLTAFSNIVYTCYQENVLVSRAARNSVLAANYAYFVLHGLLPMLLYYYSLFATRSFQRFRAYVHAIFLVPFAVCEFMVLLNPVLHIVWTFDRQMNFVRGAGLYFVYASGLFYIVMALRQFMTQWAGTTKKRRRILMIALVIGGFGIITQFIYANASSELFCESISMMGLMLALEFDEDRLDTGTGVYNRSALLQDMESYIGAGSKFYCICVRLTNLDALQRVVGASNTEEVVAMVSEYLTSVYHRYMIYRVTPTSFVLIDMRGKEGQVRFLSQMIAWKFEEGWEFGGRSFKIQGVIMYAAMPDELKSVSDVLLMCESPLPTCESGSILVGEDLRAILYRANLETALHRGLAEHNFRVYYQPVYTPDGKTVYSAESLIRLSDPEFGELFPGDFIPAAERNGMIEQIGEYTLDEVCDFFNSGIPDKIGIRYINVNLSVVQCMSADFAANVKKIVTARGVDPSRINFEITETIATLDYAALDAVIRELKSEGYMFSMEAYGTGYSNLHSIFSLDLDMIKMDRRLLWEAEKGEEGWTVLENSVRLIHDLKHEVVVVGVETREQFERTKKLGINWYQGNYFSRPLSRREIEKMADEVHT